MATRPRSAFAGLDKALLRETRSSPMEQPATTETAVANADPVQTPPPTPTRTKERAVGTPSERTYGRTGVRRVIARYAFEFYQDQLAELRDLSLHEKLEGGKGSMSEMVREALDQYLAKRKKEVR